MASKSNDDITLSKQVIEMATVANEFCYFVENIEKKEKEIVLEFMQRILPLLHLKGSLLPEIEPEHPEANERFVTEEQWERVFNELRQTLGEDDEYWIIDPQYINDTEPLKASLSENITDIYQDMKDFLLLMQKNTHAARENAISECKILHANHWGYRVGNIFTRIHHLIYFEEDSSSDF
ncbi:MAG: DUF5063 domain-containing protein [Lentimicrobiaceae bacterium]|jgi:hypothetical protein|nr:DUF5063 domain-containing protein [Lentimicrobiaceae bacterium]MCP4910351.1 DUF5063 domain-containing protein [Bacteroidota bacterium]MBT3817865.1 DUF5063 domain-containing protein [Lentimicrobiaceae bacterium]MBT4060688.1 DUF5063 domain-containing protein [Lentimicrobiaceae bacterium]MBT4191236.1 DUF5063 domain-containing protein [Lentimicrobiaceae bacterium]